MAEEILVNVVESLDVVEDAETTTIARNVNYLAA